MFLSSNVVRQYSSIQAELFRFCSVAYINFVIFLHKLFLLFTDFKHALQYNKYVIGHCAVHARLST